MRDKKWTNEAILHEMLRLVIQRIYDIEEVTLEHIREEVRNPRYPSALKDDLIKLQLGVLLHLFHIIDGNGPEDWPGVKLVHARTRASLSRYDGSLNWAVAKVEGNIILEIDRATYGKNKSRRKP
jgi:hypothetical protein